MKINKMICSSENMWDVLKVWATVGRPTKVLILSNIFGEETVLYKLLEKKGCDVSVLRFGGNIIEQSISQVAKWIGCEIEDGTLLCCNAERKVLELGIMAAFRETKKREIVLAFLEQEQRRVTLAHLLFGQGQRIQERVYFEKQDGKIVWLSVDASALDFEDYCSARGCSINPLDARSMDEVNDANLDCYEYFGGAKTATNWASGLLAFLIQWHKKNKKAFAFMTMKFDKKMLFVVMNRKTGKPWWIIPHFASAVESRDWRSDEILFIHSDDLSLECNLAKKNIIAFGMNCDDVDASMSAFSNLMERLS